MRLSRAFLMCLATVFSSSVLAFTEPPFPRIATVNFSQPQNYDNADFEARLARYNIAMFSVYPGWSGDGTKTMQQSVQAIKNINPNELVFLYISNNEIYNNQSAVAPLINKVNAQKWWLYPASQSGTKVASAFAGTTEVNNTLFAKPDSNGDRWVEWYAKWAVQQYYVPSPAIDGFFTDNVFWKPRVNGDWNLDGVSDSSSDPTVQQWYRQGYNRHFQVLNQQMPGKYQVGNVTDWGQSTSNLSYLSGVLNGGLIEALIGFSYSPETWGSWSEMMREYRAILSATIAPKLVMFGQVGVANDYQAFRYGFTSCLMDNGYYTFSLASNAYSGTFWFDEFNVKLGKAVTNPSTTAWQNGVYRRDFENGIALVNPRGNGAQTVTLESQFVKVSGQQDPATNNGQTVTTVTLKDRDGIILLRTSPVSAPSKRPLPPSSLTVQ